MTPVPTEHPIVKLLLGGLAEEERVAWEEAVFTDDALLEELLAAEEAILEGSLDGTLDGETEGRLRDALRRLPAVASSLRLTSGLRIAAGAEVALAAVAAGLALHRALTLRLRPGLERGGDATAGLTLSPELARVDLELVTADAGELGAVPRIQLETASGEVVGSREGRLRVAPGGDAVVEVAIERASLRPGLLRIRLMAAREDGTLEDVDDYFLKVTPHPGA